MFNPSDFDDAVPKYTNGNYASNPSNPLYVEEPGASDFQSGVEPLQTLPAQWWNWLVNGFTARFNKLNIYVKNIFNELTQLLSLVDVTPDATENAITTGQIKDVFENKYPNYISKFIHTLAQLWSYTGTVVVGDVTTTQTTKLAVYEHVNTSDASTTPPTETDEYSTKYVETLPQKLGGTGADNNTDAINNLCSDIPLNTPMLASDEILYLRNSEVKKADIITLANIISQAQDPRTVKAKRPRWLRFDFTDENHKTLKIDAGTRIAYPSGVFIAGSSDFSVDLSANMTTSAGSSTNGKDFFVYVVPADNANYGDIVCSVNATAPTDIDASYTSDVVLKIGRFHTLCAAIGASTVMKVAENTASSVGTNYLVKPYRESTDPDFYAFYNKSITAKSDNDLYDTVSMLLPLAGFSAGDILPESVWCLTFRPDTVYEDAMVYDVATGKAVDIYMQSGSGKNTRSAYNETVTVSKPQTIHKADMLEVGKELLSDTEFTSAALGSNEASSYGANSPGTTGGHSDSTSYGATTSRRMVSAIGCEDMCGAWWQWLRDVAPLGTGSAYGIKTENGASPTQGQLGSSYTTSVGWLSVDGVSSFGKMYDVVCGLCAGGCWTDGSRCGSRARDAHNAVSYVSSDGGGRGSSRILTE